MKKLKQAARRWVCVMVVITCGFILPAKVSAQKFAPMPDTLALLKKLARHPKNDTAKVVLLYQLADAYRSYYNASLIGGVSLVLNCYQALKLAINLNWRKGIMMHDEILKYAYRKYKLTDPLINEVVLLAKKLPDNEEKYKIYQYLGSNRGIDATAREGFLDQALAWYRDKKDIAEVMDVLEKLSGVNVNPADSQHDKEEKSNAYLEEALAIAKSMNNKKMVIHFLNAESNVYRDHQKNKAIGYSEQAAAMAEEQHDYDELSDALFELGFLYYDAKEYEKAVEVNKKGTELAGKIKDKERIGFMFNELANDYAILKKYDLAEKNYLLAVNYCAYATEAYIAYGDLEAYYLTRANYLKAIEAGEKSLYYIKQTNNTGLQAQAQQEIGDIYALTDNKSKALECYNEALKIDHNGGTTWYILMTLGNLYSNEDPLKAINYFNQSIQKELSDAYIARVNKSGRSVAFYNLRNYSQALADAEFAVKDSTSTDPYNQRAVAYRVMGSIIRDAPDSLLLNHGIKLADRYKTSLRYLNLSRNLLEKTDQTEAKRDLLREAGLVYEKQQDYANAYGSYRQYITLRDSVLNRQAISAFEKKEANVIFSKKADSIKYKQQIAESQLKQQQFSAALNLQSLNLANKEKDLQKAYNLKTQADLKAEQNKRQANEQQLKATRADDELQKTEISAKKAQTYYLLGGIAALLALSFFIAQNYRNQRKATQRSDALLLNILPADVAEELKNKGSSEARLFDEVTVLFTDFVNFTNLSELLSPKELVEELNICFKAFDGIMVTHHIEKIKTIGDAYLAVAGLPNADVNHALNTIRAALEIRRFVHDRKAQLGDKTFNIRIGIHSGSVVAGIVGVKKFAYDIWGDTVNTAARMEQNSEPGKINVSEKTYELVKERFAFTYRGEIEAKNKGAMKMYFVG